MLLNLLYYSRISTHVMVFKNFINVDFILNENTPFSSYDLENFSLIFHPSCREMNICKLFPLKCIPHYLEKWKNACMLYNTSSPSYYTYMKTITSLWEAIKDSHERITIWNYYDENEKPYLDEDLRKNSPFIKELYSFFGICVGKFISLYSYIFPIELLTLLKNGEFSNDEFSFGFKILSWEDVEKEFSRYQYKFYSTYHYYMHILSLEKGGWKYKYREPQYGELPKVK